MHRLVDEWTGQQEESNNPGTAWKKNVTAVCEELRVRVFWQYTHGQKNHADELKITAVEMHGLREGALSAKDIDWVSWKFSVITRLKKKNNDV